MPRDSYDGTTAYAHAKRAQVTLAEMWAETLRSDRVVVHTMHPGWADTPGVRRSLPTFRRITGPLLRTRSKVPTHSCGSPPTTVRRSKPRAGSGSIGDLARSTGWLRLGAPIRLTNDVISGTGARSAAVSTRTGAGSRSSDEQFVARIAAKQGSTAGDHRAGGDGRRGDDRRHRGAVGAGRGRPRSRDCSPAHAACANAVVRACVVDARNGRRGRFGPALGRRTWPRRRCELHALQRWWAARLVDALHHTAGVSFDVEGLELLTPGPIIMCARHTSVADSLLPAWLLGQVGMRPRYVLKDELLLDPCLDIVGNRVRNHFVDRDPNNSRAELAQLTHSRRASDTRDAAVIFPEGMVVTEDVHAARRSGPSGLAIRRGAHTSPTCGCLHPFVPAVLPRCLPARRRLIWCSSATPGSRRCSSSTSSLRHCRSSNECKVEITRVPARSYPPAADSSSGSTRNGRRSTVVSPMSRT